MAVTDQGHHKGRTAPNKDRTFPPEVLTEDEVHALVGAGSNRAPAGICSRDPIVVMYRGGSRLGESLALKPKDVDPSKGTITILHGIGERRRVVGLDPGAIAVVLRSVERRSQLGISGRTPLLCTLKGKALKPSNVRTMSVRLADRVV